MANNDLIQFRTLAHVLLIANCSYIGLVALDSLLTFLAASSAANTISKRNVTKQAVDLANIQVVSGYVFQDLQRWMYYPVVSYNAIPKLPSRVWLAC